MLSPTKNGNFVSRAFWNLFNQSLNGFLKTLRGEDGLKVIFCIIIED